MKVNVKHIITVVVLGLSGCYAMHLGHNEIAATCFGAIAAWGFLNGVKNEFKKEKESSE